MKAISLEQLYATLKSISRSVFKHVSKAQATADKAQATASAKMSAVNPTVTGYFAMNPPDNYAPGKNSHSEGGNCRATGGFSHAEGQDTTASGWCSHTEGEFTEAAGAEAHAEGRETKALGNWSHAEGNNTIAACNYQHVEGAYNIADEKIASQNGKGKYIHIVGNGNDEITDGGEVVRSNAHTLDWSGNAWFEGDVYTGGTGQDDENASKLISEKQVGKGLKMVGGALTVDEGEYELIEKIIIGYELLTAQPEDWATNWTAYYRNTGTLREPVYTLIDDATAPVWAANTFYAYSTDATSCVRNKTPEGTWYDFTSVLINFLLPTGASTPGANTEIYSSDERKLITTIWVAASDASSGTKRQRQEIKLDHGMWAAYYTTYEANAAQVYLRTHNTNLIGKMQAEYPNISQIALPRHANGAIMEIYGVWKNG